MLKCLVNIKCIIFIDLKNLQALELKKCLILNILMLDCYVECLCFK